MEPAVYLRTRWEERAKFLGLIRAFKRFIHYKIGRNSRPYGYDTIKVALGRLLFYVGKVFRSCTARSLRLGRCLCIESHAVSLTLGDDLRFTINRDGERPAAAPHDELLGSFDGYLRDRRHIIPRPDFRPRCKQGECLGNCGREDRRARGERRGGRAIRVSERRTARP